MEIFVSYLSCTKIYFYSHYTFKTVYFIFNEKRFFSPNTEPLSSFGRKFPALFSQIFPAGLLFIFSKLTTVSKFVRGLPGDPESSL